jgi:hypothetical protein
LQINMGQRIMEFQWKTKRDSPQGFVRRGCKSLYGERIARRFSFPYRGLIGKDFGFINLSNAFIDRLGVPKYHCYAPGILFIHSRIAMRDYKINAYRNLRFFQFRLNQYN